MSLTESFEGADCGRNVWIWQASKRFSVEAMVCSYHVNKDVWEAAVREELHCEREHFENSQDPFTIAVARSAATISHVLKKILSVCFISSLRGWCNQV